MTQALPYRLQAGVRVSQRSANVEASRHLTRALFYGQDPGTALRTASVDSYHSPVHRLVQRSGSPTSRGAGSPRASRHDVPGPGCARARSAHRRQRRPPARRGSGPRVHRRDGGREAQRRPPWRGKFFLMGGGAYKDLVLLYHSLNLAPMPQVVRRGPGQDYSGRGRLAGAPVQDGRRLAPVRSSCANARSSTRAVYRPANPPPTITMRVGVVMVIGWLLLPLQGGRDRKVERG